MMSTTSFLSHFSIETLFALENIEINFVLCTEPVVLQRYLLYIEHYLKDGMGYLKLRCLFLTHRESP
jgi:hypothetical protein